MSRRRFTMVEMIAVILILGIVGAVATIGFGASAKGFTLGRTRLDLAQKTQVAMQRLMLELRFVALDPDTRAPLLTIDNGGSRISFFTRLDGSPRVVELSGSELHLDGKVLMDRVVSFQATYSATTDDLAFSMEVEEIGTFSTVLYP